MPIEYSPDPNTTFVRQVHKNLAKKRRFPTDLVFRITLVLIVFETNSKRNVL